MALVGTSWRNHRNAITTSWRPHSLLADVFFLWHVGCAPHVLGRPCSVFCLDLPALSFLFSVCVCVCVCVFLLVVCPSIACCLGCIVLALLCAPMLTLVLSPFSPGCSTLRSLLLAFGLRSLPLCDLVLCSFWVSLCVRSCAFCFVCLPGVLCMECVSVCLFFFVSCPNTFLMCGDCVLCLLCDLVLALVLLFFCVLHTVFCFFWRWGGAFLCCS